jgi:hypothetical protein
MNGMFRGNCVRVVIWSILIIASLGLTGCFTSEQPFYEDSQIIQDARIEGLHESYSSMPPDRNGEGNKDGTTWWIGASPDRKGKYDVHVRDGQVSIQLIGTLFKVEEMMFLDLFPVRDSGVRNEIFSISELMRLAFYSPRHVIWKVELSDTGFKYTMPTFKNGTFSAVRQAPELKPHVTADGILALPGPPKESQKYLQRFANDSTVFNFKGELRKKQGETK